MNGRFAVTKMNAIMKRVGAQIRFVETACRIGDILILKNYKDKLIPQADAP